MKRFSSLFLILLSLACATQSAPSLDGTRWTLAGNSSITLAFADARATGSGGCNQYFASYSTSGTTLTLGPVGATKRACTEEGRNRAEIAYFDALANATSYAIEGDRLTLRDAAGAVVLEFVR